MRYFDYAATTPIDAEALEVYFEASKTFFGNASSLHDEGTRAQNLLNACRTELADLVGTSFDRVIFTSGGSESNSLAIHTLLKGQPDSKRVIISSGTEHSSIAGTLTSLEDKGYKVLNARHDGDGRVNTAHFSELLKRDDIALVTIQHVNPEIGCIQPLAELRRLMGNHSAPLHVDAVQSFGKLDLTDAVTAADSLSISAHKIYGPKGIGALIFPRTLPAPLTQGAHEFGYRQGTVNVPAIASFITAAKKAMAARDQQLETFKSLREQFISELDQGEIDFEVYQSASQAPYIVGLAFPGIQGQYMMLELNRRGFAISTGSACQIGSQKPSKTMKAIGRTDSGARELIRISFGRDTLSPDIRALSEALIDTASGLQQEIIISGQL
ncbi:IscS subfamily cysteine desulfurase [Peribacillus sp. SCS-37]|uniref:IscS subfamily cysteine desulfurase n=1 Tax=Paraperibacillus esterisolvens TaxID=3115296 RepID=UPI003905B6F7